MSAAFAEARAIERLVGGRQDGYGMAGICSRRVTQLIITGDLAAAERAADELLRVAETRAPVRDVLPMYGPHFWTVRFHQGRVEELVLLLRAAAEANPEVAGYEAALAMALARTGDRAGALAILSRLTDNDVAGVPRDVQWYGAMVCLADTADVTGEPNAAAVLADHLRGFSGRLAVHGSGVSAPVDIALAQLALASHDDAAAAALATSAAAASERMEAPIYHGRALVLLAAAQVAIGWHRG